MENESSTTTGSPPDDVHLCHRDLQEQARKATTARLINMLHSFAINFAPEAPPAYRKQQDAKADIIKDELLRRLT